MHETSPLRSLSDLGQALRQARRARGLTQAALADLAGVRAHHISTIETGATNPKAGTLFALLAALELDLSLTPRTANPDMAEIF